MKILLLVLGFLYLPLLRQVIPLFFYTDTPLFGNQYYHINTSELNTWYVFMVNHSYYYDNCSVRYTDDHDYCGQMCTAQKIKRFPDNLLLRYKEDIVYPSIGLYIYGIVCVAVGIPLIWYLIIRKNKKIIKIINVFGNNVQDKYVSLSTKIHSTGVYFLFQYKFEKYGFVVFEYFFKLLDTLFVIYTSRYAPELSILRPLLYLYRLIRACRDPPFHYGICNLNEIVFSFGNLLFSVLPTITIYYPDFPPLIITITSILLLVLPIVSMVLFILCGSKNKKVEAMDWTIEEPIKPEIEQERLITIQNIIKNNHNHPNEQLRKLRNEMRDPESDSPKVNSPTTSSHYPYGSANDSSTLGSPNVDSPKISSPTPKISPEEEAKNLFPDWDFEQDQKKVKRYEILSINGFLHNNNGKEELIDNESNGRTFKLNSRISARKLNLMYNMLDVVLDAATISMLINFLHFGLIIGGVAFGWYLSITPSKLEELVKVNC